MAILNAMTGVAQTDWDTTIRKSETVDVLRPQVPTVTLDGYYPDAKNCHSVWGLQDVLKKMIDNDQFGYVWWYVHVGDRKLAYGSIRAQQPREADTAKARVRRVDLRVSEDDVWVDGAPSNLSPENKPMTISDMSEELKSSLNDTNFDVTYTPFYSATHHDIRGRNILGKFIYVLAAQARFPNSESVLASELQGEGFKLSVRPQAPRLAMSNWVIMFGLRALGWFLYDNNKYDDSSIRITSGAVIIGWISVVGDGSAQNPSKYETA